MAWGTGSAEAFAANSANFRAWGVNSLMSFNEPDVSLPQFCHYRLLRTNEQQGFDVGGSSISPADAAVAHQQIFNATLAAEYRIGSPAVARGGQAWLQVSGVVLTQISVVIDHYARSAMDRSLRRELRLW
jgi:hypothetical protein